MMPAELFARQGSLWRASAPTLEQFTRWVNKNSTHLARPVPSRSDPQRNSLISETAFATVGHVVGDLGALEAEVRLHILRLPRGDAAAADLDPLERREIADLADAIVLYLRLSPDRAAVFRPQFPGCGVVEPAEGDILLGSELVEVKAVTRPFRGIDFRQVLTYAALGYASDMTVDRITLLNPRWGTFFSSPADDLALDIGAGSWIDLMQSLVDAMSGMQTSA